MGLLYVKEGDFKKAISEYKKSLIYEEAWPVHKELADLYLQIGHYQTAWRRLQLIAEVVEASGEPGAGTDGRGCHNAGRAVALLLEYRRKPR